MAITKIYKGTNDVTSSFLKAYKGETEIYTSTPPALPYLTFQSTSVFSIKTRNGLKNWDGVLYYSYDTTNWNEWNGEVIYSDIGNVIYMRGLNNTKITGNLGNYGWELWAVTTVECIGNIENLLDYETVREGNHPTMADYCYYYMFDSCFYLISAPELPATTLSNYCYSNMFSYTSLAIPPALPAVVLTQNCYQYMFNGCSSLTTLPQLPATTLSHRCYYYMFYNCPKIKVSTIQNGIYQFAWRIPTNGEGTTSSNWNWYMLTNTGGTFTDDPSINTTYYVENPPV